MLPVPLNGKNKFDKLVFGLNFFATINLLNKIKIILDTDIGYDPDDLFALLLLFASPEADIKLIVTADEVNGKRAKFLGKILSLLGKGDTRLAVGQSLGRNDFIVDELLDDKEYESETDYVSVIKNIIDTENDVVYLSIGGFTNLANFIDKYPEDAKKLKIYIMGGALNYSRKPGWVEHNVRIDLSSAKKVLESKLKPILIMSQTTFRPEYGVGASSPIFLKLLLSNNPVHKFLQRHCELWYEKKYNSTTMHDPLTVSVALGKSFVTLNKSKIVMDEIGNMKIDESGYEISWSDPISDTDGFMKYLEEKLFL